MSTILRSSCALAFGLCLLSGTHAEAKGGLASWRFGMSKAEVQAVKACKPYKPVKSTRGLECPNFRYLGKKVNVSFVFRADKLAKVQVWLYEGKQVKTAARRLATLIAHWNKRFGGAESPQLGTPLKKTPAQLLAAAQGLARAATARRPVTKLQLKPKGSPKGFFTFASLFFNRRFGSYYLFVYRRPPRRGAR
jgi:hypothetical protein